MKDIEGYRRKADIEPNLKSFILPPSSPILHPFDTPMSNRNKVIIKAIITVFLISFLVFRMDLGKFWQVLVSASWLLVLLAGGIHLFTAVLSVGRWRTILENFNIHTPLIPLAKITFIGYFFSLFLPSGIGGDFIRAFYLSKRVARGMSTTLTTTFLERSGGLLALLLIGTATVLVHPIQVQGYPLLLVFLLLLAGFFLAMFMIFHSGMHRRLARLLERFHLQDIEAKIELVSDGLRTLRRNLRSVLIVMLISLIIQFLGAFMMWVAALAIRIDAPFSLFLIFIPIVNLTLMVPLTINGIGLRETVYYLLFSEIGLPVETAVTLSILNFIVVALTALPGGIVYSFYKKEKEFPSPVLEG